MATKAAQDAWASALLYIKSFRPGATADASVLELQVLNAANRFFHLHAPWSWTLGELAEVTLANGTQDYAIGSPPSDYLAPHRVAVLTQGRHKSDLDVVAKLPPSSASFTGDPKKVAIWDNAGALTYRVWPEPTGMTSGSEHVLRGQYKLTTTEITAGNKGTADVLLFPDDYYHVYEALVLYFALFFANDTRAGSTQIATNGSRQHSGIMGLAMSALADVRTLEPPAVDSLGVEP